jgi:acyl-CoA synthetase (AMP-forming)/AMP-acid ligase II
MPFCFAKKLICRNLHVVRGLIADYKCPRSVELRSALPISPAGKVLKAELRAPF